MAHTVLNLTVRNAEAAKVLANLNNQNLTITYTYTAAVDLTSDVLGTLVATTSAVNYPPEINPVSITPDIPATPQSN